MQEFINYVKDCIAHFGPIHSRKMFGGYGLFHQGLMFALISDDELYLKVDEQTKQAFIDLGSGPFTYIRQNKAIELSYYQAPEILFEDSEAALYWANLAYQAALRQH